MNTKTAISLLGISLFAHITGFCAVTFYNSPGGNPDGEAQFRAVMNNPPRIDFESSPDINSLQVGSVAIGVASLSTDGNLLPGGCYLFRGRYEPEGQQGTVGGVALYVGPTIRFTFSQPVLGFGLWAFDDGFLQPNALVMRVTEANGQITTAPAVDAGNLTDFEVEGFLSAVSDVGITAIEFANTSLDGNPIVSGYEVDNLQLVPMPPRPVLRMRTSQVELCWDTDANSWYQLQYRSALTTNQWLPLMTNWFKGDGATFCTNDVILPDQPQRYYQVLTSSSPR